MWTYRTVHGTDAELTKRLDRALDIADKLIDDVNSIAHNFATLVEFVTKPPDPVTGIVAEPTGQPGTH